MPQLTVGALEPGYPGDPWHYVLSRIVTTARAFGLQAIDGPYAAIRDLDGFREVAQRSRLLGFDGKWALHPDQIAVCNEVYRPGAEEFERALRILEAYRTATDSDGVGAAMFEGEMIDEASRKMASATAERGRAAGMVARSSVTAAPLADIRVLAIEQYGAGPWGTLQLADLGAEVIKIEDPTVGGDVSRYVPPYQEGESSLFFETFNRSKRSVSLDLRHPQARAVFEDLVRSVRRRLLEPARRPARQARPALRAPRGRQPAHRLLLALGLRHRPARGAREGAYDYTLQGLAGWQSITGEPDGPPTKSGLSLVDFCGGYVAALAILAGVWRARRDGRGSDVDLSLFEMALAQLTYLGTWVASRGYEPVRRGDSAHQSIVPFQNFATADGWIVVACPKQTLWEQLCGAIGRESCCATRASSRSPLATSTARRCSRSSSSTLRGRDRPPTGSMLLAAAGVPCAPVNDVAAALADVQVAARGAVVELEHPVLGAVAEVASPFRFDGRAGRGAPRAVPRARTRTSCCASCAATRRAGSTSWTAAGVFGELPLASEVSR